MPVKYVLLDFIIKFTYTLNTVFIMINLSFTAEVYNNYIIVVFLLELDVEAYKVKHMHLSTNLKTW